MDRSAGTIMCTTQLLEAASKQWGAELTAVRLLPLLSPLLVSPALSATQFKTAMGVVQVSEVEVGGGLMAHHHDSWLIIMTRGCWCGTV